MARCGNCDQPLSDDRDHLGARCPSCRHPIYEAVSRFGRKARPAEPSCARHPGMESVGPCARCASHVCETCRTSWRGVVLCIGCLQKAVESAEATPAMARAARWQSLVGLGLASLAWILVGVAWVLLSLGRGTGGDAAPILTLSAIVVAVAAAIPAGVGMGLSAAALRGQSELSNLSWAGFVVGGVYVGLTVGLGAMGLWQG